MPFEFPVLDKVASDTANHIIAGSVQRTMKAAEELRQRASLTWGVPVEQLQTDYVPKGGAIEIRVRLALASGDRLLTVSGV
jgi:hypothetical protein